MHAYSFTFLNVQNACMISYDKQFSVSVMMNMNVLMRILISIIIERLRLFKQNMLVWQ